MIECANEIILEGLIPLETKVKHRCKKMSLTGLTRENIKTDSRRVANGDIFVAIKGIAHDGHHYVRGVLRKGASYVLCEKMPKFLTNAERKKVIIVDNTRSTLGLIAKHLFQDPSSKLTLYGVTGTNGKTTTVFLIDYVLNHVGKKSGFTSTVFNKLEENILKESSMTTPDCLMLNQSLSSMVMSKKSAAVIEVSSHALSQERLSGIELDYAIFTNITREHLDYHKNINAYLHEKSKIFSHLKPSGVAILNSDDSKMMSLTRKLKFPRLATFGIKSSADIKAKNIKLATSGTEFEILAKGFGLVHIKSKLIGEHNVYNILAASSALLYSGVDLEELGTSFANALAPPGRLELVSEKSPFKVFVDYAHTPDALSKILRCLRPLTRGRLICVFGCGGDRDRTKRPIMGHLAENLSDYVVLTSDNPRTEEPDKILKEIENGMHTIGRYCIIKERDKAILEAIGKAKKGDTVIIAGKGHENYQIIGKKRRRFDDREAARNVLKDLGY